MIQATAFGFFAVADFLYDENVTTSDHAPPLPLPTDFAQLVADFASATALLDESPKDHDRLVAYEALRMKLIESYQRCYDQMRAFRIARCEPRHCNEAFALLVEVSREADQPFADPIDFVSFGRTRDPNVLDYVALRDADELVIGVATLILGIKGYTSTTAGVKTFDRKTAGFGRLTVAGAHREKGVGRALLEQALQDARKSDCACMFLETYERMAPAIHLYESSGFVRVPDYVAGEKFPGMIAYQLALDNPQPA
jgi:GNAT superfamily N-acetyltransferase